MVAPLSVANTEFDGFNDAEKSGIQVKLRGLGCKERHIEMRIDDQPPQCIVSPPFEQKFMNKYNVK